MLHGLVLLIGAYLVACVVAYCLHEAAHYAVHSLYAESVTIGTKGYAPYVEAVYGPSAPRVAMRLGSLAPTIIYPPLVSLGIHVYLRMYPVPRLTLTEWTMVAVPLVILTMPSSADVRNCLNAA